MSTSRNHSQSIIESWVTNADAWVSAVREQRIPSRRLGTDDAVLAACDRVLAESASRGIGNARPRVLDVGCGEGWLARVLASRNADVIGIDASEPLLEQARASGPGVRFEAVTYEALRASAEVMPGAFDLIVCNYSLLDDAVPSTLSALGMRLAPNGALIVQTVHPWVAIGDGAYEDGWRTETFSTFAQPFPAHMPWYFRTLGSWVRAVHEAHLGLARIDEPLNPENQRPLSLLLTCVVPDDKLVAVSSSSRP